MESFEGSNLKTMLTQQAGWSYKFEFHATKKKRAVWTHYKDMEKYVLGKVIMDGSRFELFVVLFFK